MTYDADDDACVINVLAILTVCRVCCGLLCTGKFCDGRVDSLCQHYVVAHVDRAGLLVRVAAGAGRF